MTCEELIRRGREAASMTQEQLAERLGVSRQAVGKWESGKARPTAEKQARLSEALGIPPEAWNAAAAEEAAAREAPLVRAVRRWRRWTAVLAVLLCLSLTAQAVMLWYFLRPSPAEKEEPQTVRTLPADTSYMFPQRLELSTEQVEDFGDLPLSAGSGADVPTEEGGTAGRASSPASPSSGKRRRTGRRWPFPGPAACPPPSRPRSSG